MIGKTVSHYKILAALGKGGMGVVYRAEDVRLGRTVALKFVPETLANDRSALERFQREARAVSALNHPNICTLHDIDESDGRPFLVMECLEGHTLKDRIAKNLGLDEVVDMAIQVVEALDTAHSRGIVHRDIKPANIFVTTRGQVKMLDFGLAKMVGGGGGDAAQASQMATAALDELLTSPGSTIGTVAYMSPEQARGEDLDARTDLFSFGVVLYEMVTGVQPFQASSVALTFVAILQNAPVAASRARPEVSAELERIINKALEKSRDLRYQNASDLRADLKRLRRDTVSGRASIVEAPPQPARRPILLGIAAAVVVVAAALGAFLHYRAPQASQTAVVPTPPEAAPQMPKVMSLAVLPFRDLSGQKDSEEWGIGVADAIISRLATLQNLAVRPTNSVLKYAKGTDDLGQAARELEVNSVLVGTYQRAGGLMRVSVQLIDHGTARWAGRYDLQGHDLLHFEDDVAQKVVDGLKVQLSGAEQESLKASPTDSAEAYNLLVQARAYWTDYFISSTRETLQNAVRLAQRAIEKDPKFVDAYALLAESYALQATNFQEGAAQNLALAEQAALKAVSLNPKSFEATLALGLTYGEEGKNAEAIRILRESVSLAPNSATAWKGLGYTYHYAGLIDLAEAAFRRNRDLDPSPAQIYWMHGRMLLYQGKAHDSEEEVRGALERYPDQFKLQTFLGYFLYYQGKSDEAVPLLDRALQAKGAQAEDDPTVISAMVHASRGERDKIAPRFFRYKPEETVDGDMAEWIGSVYALLGDKENALVWLRRAVAVGDHNYPWFQRDKNWDKLRGDREFERIMSEVEGYWKHYKELFGSAQG